MKDYELETRGFNTPKLAVRFFETKIYKKSVIAGNDNEIACYSIVYSKKGNFQINCSGKSFKLGKGDVFIAKPFEKFKVVGITENDISKLVCVFFLVNTFDNIKSDTDFLRVFSDRKNGEFNIYTADDFDSPLIIDVFFNQFYSYFEKNVAFCHYALLVGSVISILDLAFDHKFSKRATDSADEYAVRIYDYISGHFTTPLTAEMMTEKFSISKWYLDKVTKKFYGYSFLKTLKVMRMWHSRHLISLNSYKLAEIAKLCGYNDYSAFYRCYIGYFGISPAEDVKIFRKTGSFYNNEKEW